MEWVETTGRTVEEALDAALDTLGVHEDDVEYEVLAEPKAGLFGRFGGSEARIRARVKPVSREKPQDRRRRRARAERSSGRGRSERRESPTKVEERGAGNRPAANGDGAKQQRAKRARQVAPSDRGATMEQDATVTTADLAEQAATAEEFTQGLVDAFGLGGSVSCVTEEDTITVEVTGEGLGLLIGPRGATVSAIEELVRAVVQRATGGHGARILVDVAGYRARRRAALEEFTRELAAKVLDTGEEAVLEPMGSADRKVVHDAVGEIDGVETSSEGEDPRRYVVIRRS